MKIDKLLGLDYLTDHQKHHYSLTIMGIGFKPGTDLPPDELAKIKTWIVEDLTRKQFNLRNFKSRNLNPSSEEYNAQLDPNVETHYNHLMNQPLTELYDLWITELRPALIELKTSVKKPIVKTKKQ